MDTQANSSTSEATKSPSVIKVIFQNLQLVLGVGVILATLFTIWTPGEFVSPPTWQVAQFAPIPTLIPTSGPTVTPNLKPVIGIVAGHWGNDSGAVCPDGLTEVEINQNIATIVQKKLVDIGYSVDLLQEFDTRLTNYRALVLVSIHADSCDYINEQATGYKVAAALASPDPIQSTRLSACLRSRYAQVTGKPLHSTSVTQDMTAYHAFSEIDPGTVAAIIETGFLNLDRKFLTEDSDVAAQGIVEGILCFLNNEDITNTQPGSTTNP